MEVDEFVKFVVALMYLIRGVVKFIVIAGFMVGGGWLISHYISNETVSSVMLFVYLMVVLFVAEAFESRFSTLFSKELQQSEYPLARTPPKPLPDTSHGECHHVVLVKDGLGFMFHYDKSVEIHKHETEDRYSPFEFSFRLTKEEFDDVVLSMLSPPISSELLEYIQELAKEE